jgi:hypothetical protein
MALYFLVLFWLKKLPPDGDGAPFLGFVLVLLPMAFFSWFYFV